MSDQPFWPDARSIAVAIVGTVAPDDVVDRVTDTIRRDRADVVRAVAEHWQESESDALQDAAKMLDDYLDQVRYSS